MFRKIVTAVIVVPLAAVIIAFAVANRQAVTVSFDPFSSAAPAYAATVPLFVLIFILLILGVIVGGVAAWLRQAKWRRTARSSMPTCARCTRSWRPSAAASAPCRRRPPSPPLRSSRRRCLEAPLAALRRRGEGARRRRSCH